jgi:hypothetical protein
LQTSNFSIYRALADPRLNCIQEGPVFFSSRISAAPVTVCRVDPAAQPPLVSTAAVRFCSGTAFEILGHTASANREPAG